MEQDGVPLMVSRYLLILLGYYLASLLSTVFPTLTEGPVDIALLDEPAVIPCGI